MVYLVPIGRGRFELYTEATDDAEDPPGPHEGFIRRKAHQFSERWREAVHAARRGEPARGRLARLRDRVVSYAAEAIAEQRTLWALRNAPDATLVYPADLDDDTAMQRRLALLSASRRHHRFWLLIDGPLGIVMGPLLFFVPGPNVVAYYLLLRAIGHYLSWKGASHGLDLTRWSAHPEPALAELGRLADLPRESRASRVAAIASGLNLPRLVAFFDRTAVPAR